MKKAMVYFLLLAGTLLLAGCQKEGRNGSDEGLIRFSATARPDTKTEYGAYNNRDADEATWQSINWVNGDHVRIYSDNAKDRYFDHNYADYIVIRRKEGSPDNNYRSTAELSNASAAYLEDPSNLPDPNVIDPGISNPAGNDDVNGLVWGSAGFYTFYGIYPPSAGTVSNGECTLNGNIVANQSTEDTSEAGRVQTNMSNYGFLTAASRVETEVAGKGPANGVTLEFEPAFTAFEFSLKSDVEEAITLKKFELIAATNAPALAGAFTVKYNANLEKTVTCTGTERTISFNFPANTTVSSSQEQSFTIFALPQDLTGLTLRMTIVEGTGDAATESTRTLPLTFAKAVTIDGKDYAKGDPIPFKGFKKHRINGLVMPGNLFYFYLTLNGVVQDWTLTPLETSFTEQIQCTALTFDKSALEMTDYYKGLPGSGGRSNHYQTGAPVGDGRWQVRTLNAGDADHEGKQYQFFTVTFRPTAPLGGYWKLDTHGNEYFTVQVVTETEADEPTLSPLPEYGQIMDQTIQLRVTPNWVKISEADDNVEIGLYMDCFVYTDLDAAALDANTEFQDIHGNGTYSYWLLTVER